ncbi:hypothetical protein BGZ95_003563 [Linnemannia exigua]|uniref:Adhesin domain-containing protein n=1 Tax=Linnemannia exigua TaxID=604196 RepID=A0AAD4DI13_9FUNG|nr:hypothetical protein BGZ95_003563 [Linnemannia exigua]
MSYDKKAPPLDEQSTFGSQAPFASGPSAPPSHDPYYNVPTDVPPEYTGPSPVTAAPAGAGNPQTYLPPTAPLAPSPGPQHHVPQQHSPYGHIPPGQDPRQQQQQPYYGGVGPSTNYGATSNAASPFPHNNNNFPPHPAPQGYYYDNNGKPYQPVITAPPVPQDPRGYGHGHGRRRRESVSSDSDSDSDHHHRRSPHARRKRKKSGNCCTCCCLTILFIFLYCWYLVKSFAFPNSSCSNTDGHETSVDTMFVQLVPGLNYKYEATEEISGNIVVNESDNWDEKGIRIHVIKRASSNSILNQIVHTLENVNGTSVSRVHLRDTLSKDEKKKIANGQGCLKADVEITYPSLRRHPTSGLLQRLGRLDLSTISGEVSVKFKSAEAGIDAYSLDRLKVAVVNGDLEVSNVVVVNKTKIEIVNGQISANLITAGAVNAGMVNGGTGLTITSEAPSSSRFAKGEGHSGWNPENLDVQASVVNGPISTNHFHGHFALESKVGSTSFTVPDIDRKTTPTNPSGSRTEGWISEDGKEPPLPLPRLIVQAAIGNIKVKVQPN